MCKRILLPLGGSALAEEALPHAVSQAEHFQAELILLKVLEPVAKYRGISLEAAPELVLDYLERVAAGFEREASRCESSLSKAIHTKESYLALRRSRWI